MTTAELRTIALQPLLPDLVDVLATEHVATQERLSEALCRPLDCDSLCAALVRGRRSGLLSFTWADDGSPTWGLA